MCQDWQQWCGVVLRTAKCVAAWRGLYAVRWLGFGCALCGVLAWLLGSLDSIDTTQEKKKITHSALAVAARGSFVVHSICAFVVVVVVGVVGVWCVFYIIPHLTRESIGAFVQFA